MGEEKLCWELEEGKEKKLERESKRRCEKGKEVGEVKEKRKEKTSMGGGWKSWMKEERGKGVDEEGKHETDNSGEGKEKRKNCARKEEGKKKTRKERMRQERKREVEE